ncbi:hypothetical protein [Deinococcus hohokamensis]|uniref:Uncharacterized protein n=1 Tax=Deinococcus hohokamensis TaxID=309883 RepID=A0ABV9IDW4_9DEIO
MLEDLFPVTVSPAELPATYAALRTWPRPVSVLVEWTRLLD